MNILSLNVSDMGGLSYNLCEAINKLTPHYAVNVVVTRAFTLKPVMANLKRRIYIGEEESFRRRLKRLVKNADVLHINEKWHCLKTFRINPRECRDKKIVYHVHGSAFRRDPTVLQKFIKAFPQLKIITSTPDLLADIRGHRAKWFPAIVPIEPYRRQYRMRRNRIPVIYYSPTGSSSRQMKAVITRVTDELRREELTFTLRVTTNAHHSTNMMLKAQADIYYDEIAPSPFYGVNPIEAAAFELAVICNMTRYARRYMKKRKIRCPFRIVANEEKLKDILRRLLTNKRHRENVGKAGYQYVRKMHSPQICVRRFLALVE